MPGRGCLEFNKWFEIRFTDGIRPGGGRVEGEESWNDTPALFPVEFVTHVH